MTESGANACQKMEKRVTEKGKMRDRIWENA